MFKRFLTMMAAALLFSTAAMAARTDLTVGMVLEPPGLDPTAEAAASVDEVVYANIFEGLTRIGPDGTVMPALAKSWTISDDGLVYTFKLHEGVKFHDGNALVAGDVVFSLNRARGKASTNAQKPLFASIANVEAKDGTTVVVTLSKPSGEFLYNMGWGDAVIVAPESAATNKEKPIGTGPFKFEKWQRGASITLVKNPDYWGTPARLNKVTFRFIPDPAAATASLLAGDVQAFPNLPAPEAIAQFKADPRFTVVIGSTEGETILATNNKKPPFDNILVRRAMAYAIDRKGIIDGAMFGLGTPIGTHFAPYNPAYVDLTNTYPYNPAKAKELLAEAGFPNGFKATLKLPPPSYARRSGEIIASQLRAVGIDLKIIPVEWGQWLEQVFKGKDYDLTIVSHTEPNDINIYARDGYYFNYNNPVLKTVIDELSTETDTEARNALYRVAQKIITNDAVNVYLFQLTKNGVWDAKLHGLWTNAPIQANDLTGVSWSE